uniref:Transmembrane protein n=1 Tax=Panagrellus redivivus TaxID=6233 RepID=A0A7E4V220_PANRE
MHNRSQTVRRPIPPKKANDFLLFPKASRQRPHEAIIKSLVLHLAFFEHKEVTSGHNNLSKCLVFLTLWKVGSRRFNTKLFDLCSDMGFYRRLASGLYWVVRFVVVHVPQGVDPEASKHNAPANNDVSISNYADASLYHYQQRHSKS